MKDQYDPVTGKTYKAFQCVNDRVMAERCKVKDANECLWSIKANANFNNEIATLLRNGFLNKKINLLCTEMEAETRMLDSIKGFHKLTPTEQSNLKIPYVMTSLLINELINLQFTINDGKVKIFEKSGARKDMYSSLAYGFWVLNEIQRGLKPKNTDTNLATMLLQQTKRARLDIGIF